MDKLASVKLQPLVGRGAELAVLGEHAELARRGTPQLVVLYGRRRVGKTFLLLHHAHRLTAVPHCYSAATRDSAAIQRRQLVGDLDSVGVTLVDGAADSWINLFDALVDAAAEQPISVALDETPYFIDSDQSWASALQRSWDRALHSGRPCSLMIVLTGSAVSVMTDVVSSGGPLYERPNRLIHLAPFDLPTSAEFLQASSAVEAIEANAACGGYPLLLSRWDTATSTEDNLIRLAGDPVGALAANASTLLLDLADVGGHRRVLGAIGRGAHRYSEIVNRAGQRAERSLDVLRRSGFVRQRHSIGQPRSRDPHYVLDDTYLQFWFTIVEPKLQLIESGQGAAVIRQARVVWTHHVAAVFEEEARRHAARLVVAGLLDDMTIGEWWTDRPEQAQIDIVGQGADRSWLLAGEAKWRDRFTISDLRAFDRLLAVAGSRASKARHSLWTKVAPDPGVRALRPETSWYLPEQMVAAP